MGLLLSKSLQLCRRICCVLCRHPGLPSPEVVEAMVSTAGFQQMCALACTAPYADYPIVRDRALQCLADQHRFSDTKYRKDWVYLFVLNQQITLQRRLEENVIKDNPLCVFFVHDHSIAPKDQVSQLIFRIEVINMQYQAQVAPVQERRQFRCISLHLSGPQPLAPVDQHALTDELVYFVESIALAPERVVYFAQFCPDVRGYQTRSGQVTVPGAFVVNIVFLSIATDTRLTDLADYTRKLWPVEWRQIKPILNKVLLSWDQISIMGLTKKTERLSRMGPANKRNIKYFTDALRGSLRIHGILPQPEYVKGVGVSQQASV